MRIALVSTILDWITPEKVLEAVRLVKTGKIKGATGSPGQPLAIR